MRMDNREGDEPFDPGWYQSRKYVGEYRENELAEARSWFDGRLLRVLGYGEGDWL